MPASDLSRPPLRLHAIGLALVLTLGAQLAAAQSPAEPASASLAASATVSAAASILLIGEQHDQPDHQRQAAALLDDLAAQGRLHALVLEMAPLGGSTAGLLREASEAQLRAALQWDERAWPWARYRDIVLAAARAGVPVLGANLSQAPLREARADARWDSAIPPQAWARLREAVSTGHCGLVPDEHLAPMVRLQVARDQSFAQVVAQQAAVGPPGRVTVLHAGAVHAARRTGVPLHLAALAAPPVRTLAFGAHAPEDFDDRRPARDEAQPDHCAALHERGMPLPASASASAASGAASAAAAPALPAARDAVSPSRP